MAVIVPMAAAVSIHAPTRGATSPELQNVIAIIVSIHAPTRGATYTDISTTYDTCFNPRPHAGGDLLTKIT